MIHLICVQTLMHLLSKLLNLDIQCETSSVFPPVKAMLFIHLHSNFSLRHSVSDGNLVSGMLMRSEVCLIGSAGVLLSTTANGVHGAAITWSQQDSPPHHHHHHI